MTNVALNCMSLLLEKKMIELKLCRCGKKPVVVPVGLDKVNRLLWRVECSCQFEKGLLSQYKAAKAWNRRGE